MSKLLSGSSFQYSVTVQEEGSWLHAPGSDFSFAYLLDSWDHQTINSMTEAFERTLQMSSKIKESVKNTSGQDVVNGLYLLDQPSMTKAMNNIPGMGQTKVSQHHMDGEGIAASINEKFFRVVLAGISGNLEPINSYLTDSMGKVQAQTKKSTVTTSFGTVIGLVSLMPILNVPVITFTYAYASASQTKEFTKILCVSTEKQSYNIDFTTVNYNYVIPG